MDRWNAEKNEGSAVGSTTYRTWREEISVISSGKSVLKLRFGSTLERTTIISMNNRYIYIYSTGWRMGGRWGRAINRVEKDIELVIICDQTTDLRTARRWLFEQHRMLPLQRILNKGKGFRWWMREGSNHNDDDDIMNIYIIIISELIYMYSLPS